ncbi:type I 3-dehydroquinase-domain-containing protein [Dactylonectria estremocensis]|uniref:3-dehydroquinate dehydratase n=1 Tax=Dactylonectria estremocensis TaxID=1079267 RepID=A0A9P9DMA8_9HYPO|nr:type I 3-dehydroquinase-domain-containing protein [Dactylonectria estremocensis]
MTCLCLVYDTESSFLVDLAASITGYAVQPQLSDLGRPGTVVAFDRGSVSTSELRLSKRRTDTPVLIINLRCLDSAKHPDGGGDVDTFDHEYLFVNGKFHRKDFCRFLSFVTGQSDPFRHIRSKKRSIYIGLTYPNVRVALSNMAIVSVGADALELRVDLLHEEGQEETLPSLEYVAEQLMTLRLQSELPIIFTIRLIPSGGRWPVEETPLATKYLQKALQWGVEFIDLEDLFTPDLRASVLPRKGRTKAIASHHDFSGKLDWTSPELLDVYSACSEFGDVVQIAGVATDLSETFEVQRFRGKVARASTASSPPLTAFNTGRGGKLSRILNPFLQATTHPLLPMSSAPNQLSLVEVNGVLAVLGEIIPKKIYVFQDPDVDAALMDKCFNELNLPHHAVPLSPRQDSGVQLLLGEADCGGAVFDSSSTFSDQLVLASRSPEAILTGIVDTISVGDGHLVGHNCMSLGIRSLLVQEHSPSALRGKDMLVIGRSFTEASSVVSALLSLECGQIFTLGFSIPPEITNKAVPCKTTAFEDALTSVGVFSTLSNQDRSFLAPLLGLISKRHAKTKMDPLVYLDTHASQKDAAVGVARAAGWSIVVKENISAAVLAARLRVLVGQSIHPDFLRMVRRQQLY